MISQATLSAMVRAIHDQPELTGCLIGFQGNGASQILHPGFSASANSERIIVVIEEYESNDPAVLQDDKFWAQSSTGTPENAPNPIVVTNRSRVGPELLGAGLTCGMTVVAAFGVPRRGRYAEY